jgi:heavy metal sensor kinase
VTPFGDERDRETVIEIWDSQNVLYDRHWPLDESLVEQYPPAPARDRDVLSVFTVATGLRLRSLSVPIEAPDGGARWTLRVMRQHVPARTALQELLIVIGFALPTVVALLVVGGYVLTRHWLRPLEGMVNDASTISAHDLSIRLSISNPSDEIGRLASAFNNTLDRLQRSFMTLDRFAADASHELRTPLTTLRSVGEVGLRRSRTVEEYRDIIASMLEESQRLQHLVQRLLELARAERGPENVARVPTSLKEVVDDCVSEAELIAESRGQKIHVRLKDSKLVTDPILLGQALRNLLENAIKYSPEGTRIEVTAGPHEEGCRISVADQGPGIPPEHRASISNRFYRVDSARERSKGGFGLGLAITKAYMNVLGGNISFEPASPEGSIFHLTLPTGLTEGVDAVSATA